MKPVPTAPPRPRDNDCTNRQDKATSVHTASDGFKRPEVDLGPYSDGLRPMSLCSIPAGGQYIPLFSTASRPLLGPTQVPTEWVLEVLSPGVKRASREADHSPPPSAEFKNRWSYNSIPPYIWLA
jgi:hypothetical protein